MERETQVVSEFHPESLLADFRANTFGVSAENRFFQRSDFPVCPHPMSFVIHALSPVPCA
jgi:hypothetical protein